MSLESVQKTKEQLRARPLYFSFSWALAGNVVYALSQWGMVIALARLSNPATVGKFMLGIAISTPVLMFTNFQLRSVLASDVRRSLAFRDYLGVRTLTSSTALVLIALLAYGFAGGLETAVVIVGVGLAKATESLSDIFYGLFQLHDRLDLSGKSMILKGVLSTVGFSGGLYFGGHILWAIAGLVAGWTALLVWFDIRRGRRLLLRMEERLMPRLRDTTATAWTLIRGTVALGVVTSLVALNLHVPRYFVQAYRGEHDQGIFSAIAYTTVIVLLVADALGNTAIPRLARLLADGQKGAFRTLMLRLALVTLFAGGAAVVGASLAGRFLLAAVFGEEYAAYSSLFVLLMTAGAMSSLGTFLTVGITAARHFRVQVAMFAVVVGSNVFACFLLVPRFGLIGASLAGVTSGVIHVLIATGLILRLSKNSRKQSLVHPAMEGSQAGL